jgi:peptidoglycan hydrolase-like protein with peptidoglycan-binding domain
MRRLCRIALVLGAVVSLAAAGCSSGGSSSNKTTTTPRGAPTSAAGATTAPTTAAPTTAAASTTTTAASSTTAASAGRNVTSPSDNVRQGDSGPGVRQIQTALVAHGYKVAVDGSFGAQTTTAVKAFQKSAGLQQDGVVGPATWGKLSQAGPTTTAKAGTTTTTKAGASTTAKATTTTAKP